MNWNKVKDFLQSKEAKIIAELAVGVAVEIVIIIISSGKKPPRIR